MVENLTGQPGDDPEVVNRLDRVIQLLEVQQQRDAVDLRRRASTANRERAAQRLRLTTRGWVVAICVGVWTLVLGLAYGLTALTYGLETAGTCAVVPPSVSCPAS